MMEAYNRTARGVASSIAALAALASTVPPLPERRRLYAGHWRMPDGCKLLRDGCGRKRYRKRVRVDGRKVAVVTR